MLSAHWYRVANIKLNLRQHISTHRHHYRGKVWYILRDEASGKHHRFNESAYRFIRLIGDDRSVNQIWEQLHEQYGDDAPTQDEVVQLLGSLYFADCILGDLLANIEDTIDRRQKQRKKLFNSKFSNPLSIKIPLLDPDKFLTRTMKLVRPLFTKTAAITGLAIMLFALIECWRNWETLATHASETALQPSNLLIILLVYPFIKGLHELGHAFAVKHWGGDVHDMGVMLLLFMPVPYVDASAATSFRSKYRRMAVAGAGIIVELLVSSIALLLWLNVQQGLFSDILFNLMLIGGISTLLFNGNPLLRFDGYYVLADAIEIPGLGARANKHIGYLIQRYVFSAKEAVSPVTAEGEPLWFVMYGIAAFIYRMIIMVTIVFFIANKYFFIGTALGLWMVFKQLLMPIYKAAQFVFTNQVLANKRGRSVAITMSILTVLTLSLFAIPMPLNTLTQGVIWMPEKSFVRAGSDGFISNVLEADGRQVTANKALIKTENITLSDELKLLKAQLSELNSQYDAVYPKDLVEAEIINDDRTVMHGKINSLREQLTELTMVSPTQGVFILPESKQLEGNYVEQGDTLAYVINFDELSVRVLVPQHQIGLVRKKTDKVELRIAGNIANIHASNIIREIPAATYKLPNKALSTTGGGTISTDPFDEEGLRTHDQYFQFDLSLPDKAANAYIGQRVYVKFTHGNEALALQWYRLFSELFLDELGKV